MDEVQQETPAAAVTVEKPEPCASFLVGGLSVALVGLGILVYGAYSYLRVDAMTGQVGLVVLGVLVTVTGVSVFLAGLLRAADALDYLVHTR